MESTAHLPSHIINRPRLDYPLERLLTGECRIVTIWAAAGSGKKTLLQQWSRALASRNVDVIDVDSQQLFNGSTSFADQVHRINRSDEIPQHRIFIVQEGHTITTAMGRHGLLSLMQDLPANVSLILTGRYQPRWSLSILQAPGVLTELRMPDLAFDEVETAALSEKCGVILDNRSVRRLLDRTGGWAAAVVTSMRWLRDTDDVGASLAQLSDNNPSVVEFLKNEVLDSLSAEEASVLTKTAIRQYVPGALAVALAESPYAREILDQISQRISFVTSQEDSYCFHPVLLSYVQASSNQQDRSTLLRGHAIAARWHHKRGEAKQAVTEATLSLQPQVVTSAVDRFGLELMLTGDSAPVLRAVDVMTNEKAHPAVIATSLLLQLSDFVDTMQVSHLFDLALPETHAVRPTESKWLAVVQALQCFQRNSHIPLVDRLSRLQSANITMLRRREFALNLLITTAEAWGASRLGDTQKAQQMLRDVRISTKRAGYTWLYLLTTQLAIDLANQTGDWHIAAACEDELNVVMSGYAQPVRDRVSAIAAVMVAKRSFRLCESIPIEDLETILTDDSDGAMFGLDILVRALRRFPELDSGRHPRHVLETLDRLAGAHAIHHPQFFSIVALRMVDLALRLDGRQRATEMAERFAIALGPECLESKTIRFLLRRSTRPGDPAETDLIAALGQKARPWHLDAHPAAWHSGASIAAWLLLARTAERQGRRDEATARLINALQHAHRVGVIQPFAAFEGEGVDMLASRAGRFGPLEEFAAEICQRVTELHPVSSSSRATKDLLTAREHEILHELPLHQSVSEIAHRKTVSVNTVKSHLRNIYQKLDADGRSQAVAKARRCGLL